ncbi:MAG: histidine phosphatase family protein [Elusimicrobia bacterium]|nr:histidine phosphatase family protein [Elusimicrobiota bacterium]
MEIIFLRHAPAGEREDWARTGRPDSERPLTMDGRKRAREAAKGLAKLVATADLVATSPWARAKETAEIAAKAFGAPLVETNFLLPHRSPASLAGWLSGLDGERVILVGHEPHLSKVIGWLMTGSASRTIVGLKKAQALLLETKKAAPGAALLVWSLPPRVLRRLS